MHLLGVIESGIDDRLAGLREEIKTLHAKGIETDDERDTDDLMTIADLSRYEKYVGIFMAFVVYERFLMDVVNVADREIDDQITSSERQIKKWDAYVDELKTRIGANLNAPPFSSLERYRQLRNKIVHQGAQILGKRKGGSYEPGSEISIGDRDVRDCIDLVQKCCDRIYERYMIVATPKLEETERRRESYDPFAGAG